MAKLVLTVTLEVPGDPNPGQPSRFIKAFDKVSALMVQGATAGEFTERYEYTVMGHLETDVATIAFDVRKEK